MVKGDHEEMGTPSYATVESAVYSTTSANSNVAKAVYVDGAYKGTANYVYVSASNTGTLTVNGERVYTYPVVFKNGEAGTLNINNANTEDGMVYEYTVNSYGVADVKTTTETLNGMVSTYSKGSNLTIAQGDTKSSAAGSYTIAYGAQLWNVENTKNVYAENLTSDMSMAVVLDGDGFVKTIFVNDTSVTAFNETMVDFGTVTGLQVNSGSPITVYSGYSLPITGGTDGKKITYFVTYDNGKSDPAKEVEVGTVDTGIAYISIPKNAAKVTITAYRGNTTPTPTGHTLTLDAGIYGNAKIYDKDGKDITSTFTGTFYKISATVPAGNVVIVDPDWNTGDVIWIGGTSYTVGARKEILINVAADTELKTLHAVSMTGVNADSRKMKLDATSILVEDGTNADLVATVTNASATQHQKVTFTNATIKAVSNTVQQSGTAAVLDKTTSTTGSTVTLTVSNVTADVTVGTSATQVFKVTVPAVVTDATLDTATGKYTTAYTVGGEDVTGDIYLAAADTLTVTVTWTSGDISGSTGDSIAIAATGATVTTSPITFANGSFSTKTPKTATISTWTQDVAITLTGSNR